MLYILTTKRTNEIFGNENLIEEESHIMHKALLKQGNTNHKTEMSINFNQAVKNQDIMSILKKKVLKLRQEN